MERNVPKLRFKGFNDEWEEKKIKETLKIKHGKDQKKVVCEDGKYSILGTGGEIGRTNTPLYMKESVLIGRKGTIDRPFYMKEPFWTVDTLFYSEINEKYFPKFIYYKFQNINWKKYCEASGVPSLSASTIESIKYRLPSLQEQERIANFLTKVDKIIEKQDEKVKNLEKYKKGMMQKIFSQEIRFKDENGEEYPEWKKKHLSTMVERVTRKNKDKISNRPLTISAQYGLVDQEEFFNKVVASQNLEGYYLLKNGEFAYNKSYSNGYPLGTIKRLDRYDIGVVSTLYICFKVKDNVSSDFLCQYFESDMWHKEVAMIAVEGARNHGLLNISVSDFLNTIHTIPCLEEQIKISNYLCKIDEIIIKQNEKLSELKALKKGLLQQMFI